MPSRWADSAEDVAEEQKRRAAKEEKKRLKAEKKKQESIQPLPSQHDADTDDRPAKRLKVEEARQQISNETISHLQRPQWQGWQHCRTPDKYQTLNPIEEGSYGHVLRAQERSTDHIVAIKRLKMDPIRDGGFPITALREIQCLQLAKHRHVVDLREVVADDKDVFLVMDFVEHDLKSLEEEMEEPFTLSEVKTLMLQLTSAVEFLHDHWILHRDLKTSNILMNNQGELKLADFGMARLCGDPAPQNLTQLVVTLWYRAPELLLGAKTYDSAIDVWSIGCIFGELLLKTPLLQGRNEVDQLTKIFDLCGGPSEDNWPGFKRLPNARSLKLDSAKTSKLATTFPMLTRAGRALLSNLLALDPGRRPSATSILAHAYFNEAPRPKPAAMFPTFPSKAGQERRRRHASPRAPSRGEVPDLPGAK